jgi:hypothetical protein
MAKATVGVTPVALPVDAGEAPVITNNGPGVLYLDFDPGLTTDTAGLKLDVDSAYEFGHDLRATLYAVATQAATDVRILVVG